MPSQNLTPAPFDPYYTWLGIRPADQPPNYYRLLGLSNYEDDAGVIENAADRQMAHVRSFQSGPRSAESQQLLTELAKARRCLLSAAEKADYDKQLQIASKAVATVGVIPAANLWSITPQAAFPASSAVTAKPGKSSSRVRSVHKTLAARVIIATTIVLGGVSGIALAILGLRVFGGVDLLADAQPRAKDGDKREQVEPHAPAPKSALAEKKPSLAALEPQPAAPTISATPQVEVPASELVASPSSPSTLPRVIVPKKVIAEDPADLAPSFRKDARWRGIAVHTSGPALSKEIHTVELEVESWEGEQFKALYKWAAFTNLGFKLSGDSQINGELKKGALTWSGNGAVGTGTLREDVLFLTWKQPPYEGENWYVPEATATAGQRRAGLYRIREDGQEVFDLDLRKDGSATKSHAPEVAGMWLASKHQLLVVWTDGWRDLLIDDKGDWKKSAYGPGVSLADTPTNTGTADRTKAY